MDRIKKYSTVKKDSSQINIYAQIKTFINEKEKQKKPRVGSPLSKAKKQIKFIEPKTSSKSLDEKKPDNPDDAYLWETFSLEKIKCFDTLENLE